MITLTNDQKIITAQILKEVFGATIDASQVVGLNIYETTVHIITKVGGLWSLGRDYFRQLVLKFKAAAVKQPKQVKATVQLSDRLWEVTGQTGNSYLIHNGRCTCKAAQYGRTCYHLKAVAAA